MKERPISADGSIRFGRLRAGAIAVAGLAGLAACSPMDEDALRERLSQWFALGGTMSFASKGDCTAAAFRLIDTQIGSSLAVVGSARRAVQQLDSRGVVALDDPGTAPDRALVQVINADRSWGYKLRRAALEGRVCMDATAESAFGYALVNPRAVLAYDADSAALMLMDPDTGVLVVAMGGGA